MYINGRYSMATNRRLDQIIEEMNALEQEHDDLGPTCLDMALAYRADSWEGAYEDYPEPTPEEIEALRVDAERNEARAQEIDAAIDALLEEYWDITGVSPHLFDISGRWSRSMNEQ